MIGPRVGYGFDTHFHDIMTVIGWGMTAVGVGAALGYPPAAAGAPARLGGRLKSDFVFPILPTEMRFVPLGSRDEPLYVRAGAAPLPSSCN